MKIKLGKYLNEVRESISNWIKKIWEKEYDESILQITDGVNLEIEWNKDVLDSGKIQEYLDIMIMDDKQNLLSEVCPTSYNPQDHDAVADIVIREIISLEIPEEH